MQKMKLLYSILLIYSFTALLAFGAFYFFRYDIYQSSEDYYRWTENWSYSIGPQDINCDTLPKKIDTGGENQLFLHNILPDFIRESDVVNFYTSHKNVRAYVDSQLIYDFSFPEKSISKTPGNNFNFIELNSSMAGKPITIVIEDCYSNRNMTLQPIFLGNKEDIFHSLTLQRLPEMAICLAMLGIGCIILLCWLLFSWKIRITEELLWLGLFSIFFSVWSLFETQLPELLLRRHLLNSWINFICFKLLFIPVIMFFLSTYKPINERFAKVLLSICCGDFFISTIMQFTGIRDFKQTQFLSILIFIIAVSWVLNLAVKSTQEQKKRPERNRLADLPRLVFMILLGCSLLIDYVSYTASLKTDSSKISRIALLIYISALSIKMLRASLDLQIAKEKAEALQAMASTDPLTKLKNRACFEEDLTHIPDREREFYGVAMFDLNKLKYFNDIHGHSMGDYYIIICSEILQDVFSSFGSVYRIGGDEFCAIMKHVTLEKYDQLINTVTVRINGLQNSLFEYHMAIADGYAVYNKKEDPTLLHTKERADKLMYEKKQKMKAQG